MQNKYAELEADIVRAYTEAVTIDDAEKLAAKFLHAQMQITQELKVVGLDARMKKAGLKAVQAAVYLSETQGKEKKPTEATLQHLINTNEDVSGEQDRLDTAEVSRDFLERYYDIFANAHIYFRGIAKGKFE